MAAEGMVRLTAANIGMDLCTDGAIFKNNDKLAFSAERIKVQQAFFFRPKETEGILDLAHASVGKFTDNKNSWPKSNVLYLDGFEYDAFAGDDTPKAAKERLEWLRLQTREPFRTQPYEQLAKVFKQMGLEKDRKKVLIAKNDDLLKYGKLSCWAKIWNGLLGMLVGYGYSPWRILLCALFFISLGSRVFFIGYERGFMQPSDSRIYMNIKFEQTRIPPETYPKFSAVMYSIDAFVPFLNLYQKAYWLPDASRGSDAQWVRDYLWLHIAAGWFFSTILVAGISRVLRE